MLCPLAQKDDPLKRIQEEINEVARRERELRQKDAVDDPTAHLDNMSGISDDSGISSASSPVNGMSSNISTITNSVANTNNSTPLSPELSKELNAVANTTVATAPVPFKRSITVGPTSSSSSSNHATAHQQQPTLHSPASHHLTTVGPTLQRAISTPQIFQPTAKRFNVAGGSQKGMMQRFLASRGRYTPGGQIGGRGANDSILVSVFVVRLE